MIPVSVHDLVTVAELPSVTTQAEWRKKVTSLSRRGITARSLIHFYQKLGQDLMPHYRAAVHTTNDVVRQAIIPCTKEMRCAYAELEGPRRAEKMVTHSWQNLFCDLIAAVIADAVQETSFDLVASLLESDASILETLLEQKGTADNVYWICAFSVNQHAGICGGNPKQDRDSLTGQVHQVCDCGLPKMFNNTPPLAGNGESIGCEMPLSWPRVSLSVLSHSYGFRKQLGQNIMN